MFDVVILFVGFFVVMLFGDFGVDVVKIEYLKGDLVCNYGYKKDGVFFWWKLLVCNKCVVMFNFG